MDVEDVPRPRTPEGEPGPEEELLVEDLFSETESVDERAAEDEAIDLRSDSSDGEGLAERWACRLSPGENPQDAERGGGRERSPRPAGRRRPRAAETLILLDWDDTLLPSTWLQQRGLRIDRPSPTEAQRRELSDAARAAARTVRVAKSLGSVVVITNAEWGWVELSCKKFLPTLWPLLENLKIRSARSGVQPRAVNQPAQWKRCAFSEELRTFCHSLRKSEKVSAPRRLHNIISVGDSPHERDALMSMTQDRSDCWGKSVKFMERPDLRVFAKQHRMLCTVLRPISQHPANLDLCLQLG